MHNGNVMATEFKNYECTICYEVFVYPVRLPCNHRFCKSCLDKHIENNTMSCPICRFRVSNWLRQLRRSNADIVDKPFWDAVQKLYPKEVEKRINGHIDWESHLVYFRNKLALFDDAEKNRSSMLHKAFLDVRWLQEHDEDWHGWPENVFEVCRNVLHYVKDDSVQTSPIVDHAPARRLSKPGEIHQEYEQFLQKELEEKKREDEENFRLSEAMIRMIEEDERREAEERLQQLRKDEELARRLEEETGDDRDRTVDEGRSTVPKTPRRKTRGSQKLPPCDSDNCTPSTPLKCSASPRPSHMLPCLDTPSTSKAVQPQSLVYLNASTPSTSRGTGCRSSVSLVLDDSNLPSISNQELSHFAPVCPGPSKVSNGSKQKKKVAPPSSRCSSGCDSIGQELNHFKPIRSSPTTPPKEGSRGQVPKMVVAQRGVGVPDLNILPLTPLELLGADVSLEELETSINLEKQLEEDRKLAMEIQSQLNEEMKVPPKADYNLRKRKRPSVSMRKKVLLDRNQSTLDNLLIK